MTRRLAISGVSWVTLAELELVVANNQHREKNQAALEMMIGAHALTLGVTLATNNVREFSRIKGLAMIDWLAGKQNDG
jgi:predicted nucleic acid-binding protein